MAKWTIPDDAPIFGGKPKADPELPAIEKAARKQGYLQALAELEDKLDNAKSNGGGLDAGNGNFIEGAHWDFEIRDLINEMRDEA